MHDQMAHVGCRACDRAQDAGVKNVPASVHLACELGTRWARTGHEANRGPLTADKRR